MRRFLWASIILVGAALIAAYQPVIDYLKNREEYINLPPNTLTTIIVLVILAVLFAVGGAFYTMHVQKDEVKNGVQEAARATTVKFEKKIIKNVGGLLNLSLKRLNAPGEVRATIYALAPDKSHLRALTEYNMDTEEDEKFKYGLNEPIVGTVWSRKQFDPIIVDVFEKKPSGAFFISKEKFEIIKNEGIHTMLYIGIPNHDRQKAVGVLSVDNTLPPKRSGFLEKSFQDAMLGLAYELGLILEIGLEQI